MPEAENPPTRLVGRRCVPERGRAPAKIRRAKPPKGAEVVGEFDGWAAALDACVKANCGE